MKKLSPENREVLKNLESQPPKQKGANPFGRMKRRFRKNGYLDLYIYCSVYRRWENENTDNLK